MLDRDGRRGFWTSFAGFSLDAMDVQLYAFVLPVLLPLWGLTHAEGGLLATVTLVSSALGGWAGGLLADRLGRIPVLKATILCLALSTCLCGLAQDFQQLLVARALQGIGFGGEWAAGAVFVAELAAPESRARMVGAVQSAWAIGWGMAAASSAILLALLPPDWGWRATFLVGVIPALLIFFYRTRVPESAAFAPEHLRQPWHRIFARPLLADTLRGSLLAIGMHGGYWAIATWWPTMLHSERGFSTFAVSAHLAVVVVGSLFGYAVAGWLSDHVGRRATLAGFALGGAVIVLACTRLPLSDAALLVLSFPLGFFALGMFSAIGPVLSELYPTELRGSGLGFCYNFGRGMAGATPLLVGNSVATMGIAHALGLFATAAYGLALLAILLLPETRGQALTALADTGG